jgi:predicted RNA-binding Zn-ribbon protein involved in translation (DUF1610 family)
MPHPVCCKCNREFKPKKNGVMVQENIDEKGDPYKIWNADLFECPKCGVEIIYGYGINPVSQEFMKDFKDLQKDVEFFFW